MASNPERMRPTAASKNSAVVEANAIVKRQAELFTAEPDRGLARKALIFLSGIKRKG